MGSIHDEANHGLDSGPASDFRDETAAQRLRSVVERDFDFIWRSARRLTASSAHVDSATLRTFRIVAPRLHRVLPGNERTYIFATAACVVSDLRRLHGRDRDESDVSDRWFADALAEGMVDGAHELDPSRARVMLDRVLGALPVDLRVVLVLADGERMRASEIGELLGLRETKVAARHRRAIAAFRERVSEWSSAHQSSDGAGSGLRGGATALLRRMLNRDPVASLSTELLGSMAQDEPPPHARADAFAALGLASVSTVDLTHVEQPGALIGGAATMEVLGEAAPADGASESGAGYDERAADSADDWMAADGESAASSSLSDEDEFDLDEDDDDEDWARSSRALDDDWNPRLPGVDDPDELLSASILKGLEQSADWSPTPEERSPDGRDCEPTGAPTPPGAGAGETSERGATGCELTNVSAGEGLSMAPVPTAITIPPATRLLQSYGPMLFRPFLIGSLVAAVAVVAMRWPRTSQPASPSAIARSSLSTAASRPSGATLGGPAPRSTQQDTGEAQPREAQEDADPDSQAVVLPSGVQNAVMDVSQPVSLAARTPSVSDPSPMPAPEVPSGASRPFATRPDLDRQKSELAAIRELFATGTPEQIRQALDYYEDEFPAGLYRPDVLALRIELLVRAGDRPGARKLAGTFEASNPQSSLLPKIHKLVSE